jgi:methyl-accepting chemotaxis protein
MKLLTRSRDALGRMRVGRQLFAAFSMVLLLTGIVGGVAMNGLTSVDAEANALAKKWLQGVGHLTTARAAVLEARDFEIKHSRTQDGSYHAEYEEKMDAAAKVVASATAAYRGLLGGDDTERGSFAALTKGWDAYQQAQKRVVALGRAKKQQDAADISDGAASMAIDETIGALDTLTRYNFDGGQTAAAHSAVVYARAKWLLLGLLLLALLLGMSFALGITRHLLGQLGGEPSSATEVAKAVADGDLSTPIKLKAGDTSSLMARLHAMQRGLADAVRSVRLGSEGVASASEQIARGNQELAHRSEQQASALQQTAATMEELGSTVRNNADNARQANQLAQGASTVAVKGGEVVGQVVETMKGINDSSKTIADIVSVIDAIAFQTNILALNAAVEAARAGEQGRGFAVVAGEVRSLAQRSAAAAKEIKTLITVSVKRVEHGTALVDRAGQTMGEIVGAIKRVTDIVGEISLASVEQSSGVTQVGHAVTQMDQATQQNAALVEQSAAAAASLRQQAQQLVQAVAVFKLGQGEPQLGSATTASHPGAERRDPKRATNVTRLKPSLSARQDAPGAPASKGGPTPARTGTNDQQSD